MLCYAISPAQAADLPRGLPRRAEVSGGHSLEGLPVERLAYSGLSCLLNYI